MIKPKMLSELDQEVISCYENKGMLNTAALIDVFLEHDNIFFAVFLSGMMTDEQERLFEKFKEWQTLVEGVMCSSFIFGMYDGSSRPIDTFLDMITRDVINDEEMYELEHVVAVPLAYSIKYGKALQLGFKYNILLIS